MDKSGFRRVARAAVAAVGVALLFGFDLSKCDCSPPPFAPVNVVTQHNDNQRTGANLHETILTPANVRSGMFGKLFARSVYGQPYSQPLYVHDLVFPRGDKHNVVFSATQENYVYAFDADRPLMGRPLWTAFLGHSALPVGGCLDLQPVVGITSTPVIDVASGTMFVVAKTNGGGPTCAYVQHGISHQLHALDLVTGLDKLPPTTICAQVPGYVNGDEYTIKFDSRFQHNRPGLLLDHGIVYVAFGSHCDQDPYWGWVFAFDAKTLKPAATPFVTTPTGQEGSIWQAGAGLAADDAGFVYAMTGNGEVNLTHSPPSVSMSFIKLRADEGVVSLASYFTVPNHAFLNHADLDLGSSGPLLLSVAGKHFITGGGKDGQLYLVNTDQMAIAQTFNVTTDPGEHHLHGSPMYWNGPDGAKVFFCPEEEPLHAYRLDKNTGLFDNLHPLFAKILCSFEMPGGFMSLSANGSRDGIVWVNHPKEEGFDDNGDGSLSTLSAVDATTMNVLWESKNKPEDTLGTFAKFTTPTIADGQVFVHAFSPFIADAPPSDGYTPSDSGTVAVYGLRCTPPCNANQECVHGKCQSCTQPEIDQVCGNSCGISNGCGGTCNCRAGYICERDIGIVERHREPVTNTPPPRGAGVCVCSPATIKRNCAGRCNVSDSCGGTCGCADNQSCNPQSQTCCDWQAECAKAGPCQTVCGGISCPCAAGYCTEKNVCCAPRCENARCGAADGCGGRCFGSCPAGDLCVDDGDGRACHPMSGPCKHNPRFCDADPAELIARCATEPRYCYVNLGRKRHQHHDGPLKGARPTTR